MALAATLALAAAPSRAGLLVEPAQPGPQDSIRVTVSTFFSATCWDDLDTLCAFRGPDTLAVTVRVQYCRGQPSCICLMYPFTLTRTCVFAPLPEGTYRVLFTEPHVNPYDPMPSASETLSFVVRGPVPAVQQSWGRLKAIRR